MVRDRPRGRAVLTGALDPAGVAADQQLVDGRIHDCPQQPIGLRPRRRANTEPEELLSPLPNVGLLDRYQRAAADVRVDVEAQEVS
jgi:hypothetical protein